MRVQGVPRLRQIQKHRVDPLRKAGEAIGVGIPVKARHKFGQALRAAKLNEQTKHEMPRKKARAGGSHVPLELGAGEQASVLVKLEGVNVASGSHAPDETVRQAAAASA